MKEAVFKKLHRHDKSPDSRRGLDERSYSVDSSSAEENVTLLDTTGATSSSTILGTDLSNLSPVPAGKVEKEPNTRESHYREPLTSIGGKDSEGWSPKDEKQQKRSGSSKETMTSSDSLQKSLLEIQSERNRLQHENDRLHRELHRTREILHNQQIQHQEDRRLLQSRGKELESTRPFLDKTDAHSFADIKSMMGSLNSEIHQLAAYMSDTLFDSGKREEIADEEANHSMKRAKYYLDDRILALLMRRDADDAEKSGVLQVAFQAALLFECTDYLGVWDLDPAENDMLRDLHARVQESNTAAVAGRWRALTITMSKYHSSSKAEQYLSHRLGRQLEKVILLGGWAIRNIPEALRNAFGERITEITKLAIKLDRAIKEGITSQDLYAHFVGPGEKYDSGTMNGAYGNPKTTDETVSCTCELGLKSFEEKGKRARLVLKAGVVVPSALV
ncbi:uncharacterized protein EV420DRAFT_1750841 [Desarmillaria tabescens]|uniref:Uncharacterized protein n=1 Tax=Armillaria tabescens TaxID=1929756 RepID=A0AA39JUU2_ARMTA|nr:uncharacterized protein EV420DRAFT_1750841 [Desarmillaria tabescens]KAK0448947.1 hypothetical protein EV420DRAFT_1750841 [Desarmillaria tabescens]